MQARLCVQHSVVEAKCTDSADHEPPDTVARLAWTLQHALTSITATSFTTVAAFAANLTSSITPVRLFGLFMMVLVLVNYVFVLTLLLALLVLREGGGSGGEGGSVGACTGEKQGLLATELVPLAADVPPPDAHMSRQRELQHADADEVAASERAYGFDGAGSSASHSAPQMLQEVDRSPGASVGELSRVRRRRRGCQCWCRSKCRCCGCVGADGGRVAAHAWLGGPFADALHAARWWVVAVAAIAVAFFAWRASLLTLPSSRPTVWRAGSNIHKYYDLVRLEPRDCPLGCACTCALASVWCWLQSHQAKQCPTM